MLVSNTLTVLIQINGWWGGKRIVAVGSRGSFPVTDTIDLTVANDGKSISACATISVSSRGCT